MPRKNQYVLTVWNAFQLASRRDKINDSPFACDCSFLTTPVPGKSPPFCATVTLQIANFQRRVKRGRDQPADGSLFPSLSRADDDLSLRLRG